jgi:hypothetical protein
MLPIFQVARGQLVRRVGECRQAQRVAAQNLVRVGREGNCGEVEKAQGRLTECMRQFQAVLEELAQADRAWRDFVGPGTWNLSRRNAAGSNHAD